MNGLPTMKMSDVFSTENDVYLVLMIFCANLRQQSFHGLQRGRKLRRTYLMLAEGWLNAYVFRTLSVNCRHGLDWTICKVNESGLLRRKHGRYPGIHFDLTLIVWQRRLNIETQRSLALSAVTPKACTTLAIQVGPGERSTLQLNCLNFRSAAP